MADLKDQFASLASLTYIYKQASTLDELKEDELLQCAVQVRALIRDKKADEARQLYFKEVYEKENPSATITEFDNWLWALRAGASMESLTAAMTFGRDWRESSKQTESAEGDADEPLSLPASMGAGSFDAGSVKENSPAPQTPAGVAVKASPHQAMRSASSVAETPPPADMNDREKTFWTKAQTAKKTAKAQRLAAQARQRARARGGQARLVS